MGLSLFLKVWSESELWMFGGREFQRVGEAFTKALSPKVQCLVLVIGVRELASDDLRCRVG